MKTIKFSLDYGAYPFWYYDENGILIENDFPSDVQLSSQLLSSIDEITERHKSLYINNSLEFSYIGFASLEEKISFIRLANLMLDQVKEALGDEYIFVCNFNSSDF